MLRLARAGIRLKRSGDDGGFVGPCHDAATRHQICAWPSPISQAEFIAELKFWRRDNIRIAPVVKAGGDEIMGITLDLKRSTGLAPLCST